MINLKIIWCKIMEMFWGFVANTTWELAQLFKPKQKEKVIMKSKIKRLLKAIWEVIKTLIIAILFGIVFGTIISFVILGLAALFNSKLIAIIIVGLIGFIALVVAFYKLDESKEGTQ